ncbi:MAG: VWA domain-containing protein [Acidobacteria bacterium]|jgi:VWFA-related protein|nr:VWA domain-containing protein [Acidobacteriota bacterium]
MRYKFTHNLALLILSGCLINAASNTSVFAQSDLPNQSRIKNFGWSLKQFENKESKDKKAKKANKSSDTNNDDNSQPASPNNSNTSENRISENNKTENNKNERVGEDTVCVETNLVINDVLVVNDKARAVTNLQPKDFIITEDGTEQKPEMFSFGDSVRRSIVLIINNRRLYAKQHKKSVTAAQRLIDKLTPQDKMAIVTTEIKLVLDFTSDKQLLKKTLTDITPLGKKIVGEDRDYGTLMAVLDEMFDEKDVRPIVIFMTNGEEAFGLKKDKDELPFTDRMRQTFAGYGGERGYGFSDVMERIKKSRATIYSIFPWIRFVGLPKEEQLKIVHVWTVDLQRQLGTENSPFTNTKANRKMEIEQVNNVIWLQMAMMQAAKLSGGYAEFLAKPEDAEKVYDTIFAVINNRYTIGYYSTNENKGGKERTVKIQVRGHTEYTILTRENYLPLTREK